MLLDVRTILLLRHPDGRVLLLRRSDDKRLFPGLITGIGGKVELAMGEAADLAGAVLRELDEETRIPAALLNNLRLRLSTLQTRGDQQVLLLWFTADLTAEPDDLASPDGTLEWHSPVKLPLAEMIPTARAAIPFVMGLCDDDPAIYNATFDPDTLRLIPNAAPPAR